MPTGTHNGGIFAPDGDYTISGTWTGGTFVAPTISSPTLVTPKVSVETDTAGVNRAIWNATSKAITNASATSLFNVTRAANSGVGGVIFYQVFATDGTDFQAMSGMVTYAMVDKAGTGTFTVTEATGNQAKALSTGTYTIAWTFVTGTGIGTVKVQPTSSLTATTHTIVYTVFPMAGAVTIL